MSRQSDFARAVVDADTPYPDVLSAPVGSSVLRRFNVYRNNVTVSLVESLTEAFPVIAKLVGDAFFAAMAREFILEHPPTSPIMALYGDAFPAWLSRFSPVSNLPYLGEVAQIEQARREAYHSSDQTPFDPALLAGLTPDQLGNLRFGIHPSVRILGTTYPALAIWARNSNEVPLVDAPVGPVLITRPFWSLQMCAAPHGTIQTLEALSGGSKLGDALPETSTAPKILAALFSSGALIERTHAND